MTALRSIALLPLRLEIRHIAATSAGSTASIASYAYPLQPTRGNLHPDRPQLNSIAPPTRKQIWVRWYPDDSQVFAPIGLISTEEHAAYDAFLAAKANGSEGAWNQFVATVGIVRARYLLDVDGTDPDFLRADQAESDGASGGGAIDQFLHGGARLKALPKKVRLYTMTNGALSDVGEGNAIPEGLLLSVRTTAMARWMFDFEEAVRCGMGIKVLDPVLCDRIEKADWLIAVGYRPESDGILEELLKRFKAQGFLGIARHHTPTNNTETQKTDVALVEDGTSSARTEPPPALGSNVAGLEPDANLLSKALGLPSELFHGVGSNAAVHERTHRALREVLWDVGTDVYRQTALSRVDQTGDFLRQLRQHFVEYVSGSGPVPALRLGDNPYGILPVTVTAGLDFTDDGAQLRTLLRRALSGMKRKYWTLAAEAPRIDIANPTTVYDSLMEVLQHQSVSHRVDIQVFSQADTGPDRGLGKDPQYLACPLVSTETNEEASREQMISYLRRMKSRAEGESTVDEIVRNENEIPLLERLLSDAVDQVRRSVPAGTQPENDPGVVRFTHLLSALIDDLDSLRISCRELAVAFLEVFDCLSYRLDAWLTSLAWDRLQRMPDQFGRITGNPPACDVGVYGWLERPGALGTETAAGYFQAPSLDQAKTGAILRSAALSGPADTPGPFNVNLSSLRARKALWFVEGLQQGYSTPELLGQQIERELHDRGLDRYLLPLRERFPLTSQPIPGMEEVKFARVIDGVKYIEQGPGISVYTDADQAALEAIRSEAAQVKDAVADLTIAEALHATVQGNPAVSAAWLQASEGKTVPPEPRFLQTPRTGRTQIQRVILPLPADWQIDEMQETDPRRIADPAVAKFCQDNISAFNQAIVTATIRSRSRSEATAHTMEISLFVDLQMSPLDLVLGGTADLERRARILVWNRILAERTMHLVAPGQFDADVLRLLIDGAIVRRTNVDGPVMFVDNIVNAEKLEERLLGLDISIDQRTAVLGVWNATQRWKFLGREFLSRPTWAGLNELATIVFNYDAVGAFGVSCAQTCDRARRVHHFLKSVLPLRPENLISTEPPDQAEITNQRIKGFDGLRRRIGRIMDLVNEKAKGLQDLRLALDQIADLTSDELLQTVNIIQWELLDASLFNLPDALQPVPLPADEVEKSALKEELKRLMDTMNKVVATWSAKVQDFTLEMPAAGGPVQIRDRTSNGNSFVEVKMESGDWRILGDDQNDLPLKLAFIDRLEKLVVAELQQLTAGDAMVVLPLMIRQEALTIPEVPTPEDTPLDIVSHSLVRSKLGALRQVFSPERISVVSIVSNQKTREEAVLEAVAAANGDIDPDTVGPEGEWRHTSVDFHYVLTGSTLTIPAGTPVVGFLVDEWTDFIPHTEETTAVAFQYATPQAEAPQAILLAVPWNDTVSWSSIDLANVIKETIELMEIRSVSAEAVVGSKLANLLPALFFAPTPDGMPRFPVRPQTLFDGVVRGRFHYVVQSAAPNVSAGPAASRFQT